MNPIKLICQAIPLGFPYTVETGNLLLLQEWIIQTYSIVPTTRWDPQRKSFSAYCYPFDYDPIEYTNKLKREKNLDAKSAAKVVDSYIKKYFVAKDDYNRDTFANPEEALYWAIQKSFDTIKTKID